MCGIVGIRAKSKEDAAHQCVRMLSSLNHRGLDTPSFLGSADRASWLGYKRLPIVDLSAPSNIPTIENGRFGISFNGEIYNADLLASDLPKSIRRETNLDSELVLHLWRIYGAKCLDLLDGMFAFIVLDRQTGDLFCARDRFGIKPLYFAANGGKLLLGSELKSFPTDFFPYVEYLPPGHYLGSDGVVPWYSLRDAMKQPLHMSADQASSRLRELLEMAVEKRIAKERPTGCFLSGGIDSSAITALATRTTDISAITIEVEGHNEDGFYAEKLHDKVPCSQRLAIFRRHFTLRDVEAELPAIVHHLEMFDEVTVGDSIPTWFAAATAARLDLRVILCGDGSDELFAGYYTVAKLRGDELRSRIREYLETLHLFDVTRLDRITMAHTVEARVPFLDRQLVEFVLNLPPEVLERHDGSFGPDKHILRRAMVDYIPEEIVQRPKKSMLQSTGIHQHIRAFVESKVPDREYEGAQRLCEEFKVGSKLEYYFFTIWRKRFPSVTAEQYHRLFGHHRHRYD
jgi:asparagine synthase (glutamine-hydrolysing)